MLNDPLLTASASAGSRRRRVEVPAAPARPTAWRGLPQHRRDVVLLVAGITPLVTAFALGCARGWA